MCSRWQCEGGAARRTAGRALAEAAQQHAARRAGQASKGQRQRASPSSAPRCARTRSAPRPRCTHPPRRAPSAHSIACTARAAHKARQSTARLLVRAQRAQRSVSRQLGQRGDYLTTLHTPPPLRPSSNPNPTSTPTPQYPHSTPHPAARSTSYTAGRYPGASGTAPPTPWIDSDTNPATRPGVAEEMRSATSAARSRRSRFCLW